MPTTYTKLVRDNIPDIIRSKGGTCVTRIATHGEFDDLLKQKLEEEVREFITAGQEEDQRMELADILEVVDALAERLGMTPAELEQRRKQKHEERGGFSQRIVLVSS